MISFSLRDIPLTAIEAISEKGESSWVNGVSCLKRPQLSDDGLRNSLSRRQQKILNLKRKRDEKLSWTEENRGGSSNEELEKNCDKDIGIQLPRRGIFGTNFSKQTRQVDGAKQVLDEEKDSGSGRGRGMNRQPVVVGCTMIDMHVRCMIDDKFKVSLANLAISYHLVRPCLRFGSLVFYRMPAY